MSALWTRRLLSAAAVSVVAAINAGPAMAADPVRIGYGMSKTGIFAAGAVSQVNAYELWREQVNARGGLNVAGTKRMVEFVSYDDRSDPAETVRIYEKLITGDKVDLLMAPWGTPTHFAIAGVLERHKFPVVGNTAASVKIREIKPGSLWFTTSALPDRFAVELVKLMKERNVKSAAVLTLQLVFPLEVKQFVVAELQKAGIKVVVQQDYPPTVKDMTAMLTAVKAAKPDAVISLSFPDDGILFMNQARQLDVAAPFFFLLVGPSIDFFGKMFGPAANNLVTLGHWSPFQAKWPRAKQFFDAYVAKYKINPDYLDSALSYASCEILEQAVAKAGLDREKLRQSIATDTFDTINGPAKFKGVENVALATMVLQLQNGEGHIVWPKEWATKPFQPKGAWPK